MTAFQEVTWTQSTSSGGTPNNLPVAMPATVAAGDVLACAIWNPNLTPPAGWTHRASSNNTSDRLRIFTKVAAGTEGGTTVNFTERAGTVAGLQFGAGVVRYRFTASAIAEPYSTSDHGFAEQFGAVGATSYTETIASAGVAGAGRSITLIAKMFWNLGGTLNPPPSYAVDPAANLLNDLGSRTFRHSTTAANGTQDGIMLLVDTDVIGSQASWVDQTVTFTAPSGALDMTVNGVSVIFSTATAELEDVIVPPADEVSSGPLYESRHVASKALPYSINTSLVRKL